MKRSPVIARRELASYFYSPIAYVWMAIFLLVCGVLFLWDFQPGKPAELRTLFDWMIFLLVAIIPLLCMGLMSQEWDRGTIETLMTAPIGETDVILGKFFGSLLFFVILLVPTLVYVIVLAIYARPGLDLGPVFSGYLGIILAGGMFIAISLFCSSLTRSQIVAAVCAAAILFAVTIVPYWALQLAALPTAGRQFAEQLIYRRYADFSRGVIDTGHVIFFLAITAVFLFLSVKVLESRRWK